MAGIDDSVRLLSEHIARLEQHRYSTPLANDVYEAASYWRDLGQWVMERNTKVDYAARAGEEIVILKRLEASAAAMPSSDQKPFQPFFDSGRAVLQVVANTLPQKDGHMGVLAIIRDNFGFLGSDYDFAVKDQTPLGLTYSSGSVWIELNYAERTSHCCTFGPEDGGADVFWPEDLLYMCGDPKYEEVQKDRILKDGSDLRDWFELLAEIWRTHGRNVLANRPGIFMKLESAARQRHVEIDARNCAHVSSSSD